MTESNKYKIVKVDEGQKSITGVVPVEVTKHNGFPVIKFSGNVARGGFSMGIKKLSHLMEHADFIKTLLADKEFMAACDELKDTESSVIPLEPIYKAFSNK
jgi:hypothetical protein